MRTFLIILYTYFFLTFCIPSALSEQPYNETSSNYSGNGSMNLFSPQELILRFKPNTPFSQVESFTKKIGVTSYSKVFSPNTPAGQHPLLEDFYLLRFSKSINLQRKLQSCVDNQLVDNVEMNYLKQYCYDVEVSDPSYSKQWNLSAINIPEAWKIEQGRKTVTVAVVDSGIIMNHPDLKNQLWNNSDEIPLNGIDDDQNGYVDDLNGWDFSDAPTLPGQGDWINRDNSPDDETGHGTHVSGIIAAETDNDLGIAGIAPNCKIMTLRAGFRIGLGSFLQNDDVAAAIVYAADNGANVINLSLGDTVNAFLISAAVEYAFNRGCVLVAAAGNSPEPGAYYPAALNEVISVASIDNNLQLGNSNFGSSIDIAAPGEDIISTDFNLQETSIQEGYRIRSGTSMATAHVSGVAALLISANPLCDNLQIQQWLKSAATELSISNLVGAGVVDAYRTLTNQLQLKSQILFTSNSDEKGVININGTAGGNGFIHFWLEYGVTEIPDVWYPIGYPKTEQIYNSFLQEFDTSELDVGIYTVRLSVKGEDRTIRDKRVIEIQHSPPVISEHEAGIWLNGENLDSIVIWKTDVLSNGFLELYNEGINSSQIETSFLQIVNSDSVNLQHIVNLSSIGLSTGDYSYRLKSLNRNGKLRIDDNGGNFYPLNITNQKIQPYYLTQSTSADIGMHAIVSPKDLDSNGKLEIIGIEIGPHSQSVPLIYEMENYNFIMTASLEHTVSRIWTYGDSDNDGLIEILCNERDTTFLLEQSKKGEYPNNRIWELQGIWGGIIVDADYDGTPEIYSRHDSSNSIWVHEYYNNSHYRLIAKLENTTKGINTIGTRFAFGDHDGDGSIEILTGDVDGDIYIYENKGDNTYQLTWENRLNDGIPQLFASGDLDGDRKPEFVIGSKVWTTLFDLPRQHWLITIYSTKGDDRYDIVWEQRIRELRDVDSGLTIGDINNDGLNELCIAVSPNFYLIKFDGSSYRPIWYHPASQTFNPIVADLDNDNLNELIFNSDDSLNSYSSIDTKGRNEYISPPWNLNARPLDENTIRLDWQPSENHKSYIIYRGETKDNLEQIRMDVTEKSFIDKGLIKGESYWYAIKSVSESGKQSVISEIVKCVPSLPVEVISAVVSPQNQLIIKFNSTMNITASNPARYILHQINDSSTNNSFSTNLTEKFVPISAILDQSHTRVVLTFANGVLKEGDSYKIETIKLSDKNGSSIIESSRFFPVETDLGTTNKIIVYPNPAKGNQITFNKLPVGSRIYIYDVSGREIKVQISTDHFEEGNKCRKVWLLDNISNGIYVFVIEHFGGRKIGTVSVVR
ncbi:S8 family serine peptidase [Candidatus Poribacteria bacterium]|nr:S8 family serine peptidase [Candidatus Poribacteria bacterium]